MFCADAGSQPREPVRSTAEPGSIAAPIPFRLGCGLTARRFPVLGSLQDQTCSEEKAEAHPYNSPKRVEERGSAKQTGPVTR